MKVITSPHVRKAFNTVARSASVAKRRPVVKRFEPQLRPEGVPVALHHVRQGQDVGVEVAVVELSEGLLFHEIGGVDGQPVVP